VPERRRLVQHLAARGDEVPVGLAIYVLGLEGRHAVAVLEGEADAEVPFSACSIS